MLMHVHNLLNAHGLFGARVARMREGLSRKRTGFRVWETAAERQGYTRWGDKDSCIAHICICIYLRMSTNSLPDLGCLCGTLRRTARALTQLYEEAMRPLGLKATQLTILQVLARAGEISQGRMGEILAMDSTTLTRTLRIMQRQGWVAERRGTDRRERWLRLSPGGKALLERALPEWEKIQAQVGRQLGAERWKTLLNLANETTEVAKSQGGSK